MPTLTIDNTRIDIADGATVLDAARAVGLDIPALCHLEGCTPDTSCLVCVVRVNGRLVPSCATPVHDGMVVESETPSVHAARRTALELLLSDHTGDCLAPCQRVCPAHMDIPLMLRQIAAGDFADALRTIKDDIALPAVLGRICPAPCEKGCRRREAGGSVSVCLLKRFGADEDLAADQPYLPRCAADTGRRVAVIGTGPAGLSAAYYLRRLGHGVTIFDDHPLPGGALRYAVSRDVLPMDVLDAEIDLIRRMGAVFRMGVRIGQAVSLAELHRQFDAVLVAAGELPRDAADPLGLRAAGRGVLVDAASLAVVKHERLFAAGAAIRPSRLAVRSGAEGKAAAESIHRYLCGQAPAVPDKPFTVTLGQLSPAEVAQMIALADDGPRCEAAPDDRHGLDAAMAQAQAARCLHCDCRKIDDCSLRSYAARYGAQPARCAAARRPVEIIRHDGGLLYEPGKCIDCGLCVQIARQYDEKLGLAFIGRGFAMRPGTPFDAPLSAALTTAAPAVVRACPTGALAYASTPPRP